MKLRALQNVQKTDMNRWRYAAKYAFETLLYVQEGVTLQKFFFNIFAPEKEVSPFINYYDTLSWILFVHRAK